MKMKKPVFFSVFLMCLLWAAQGKASAPLTRSTFHCVSLYWQVEEGSSDNRCSVSYRQSGATQWFEALPLWFDYNDHAEAKQHSHEYRGSIVDLEPGTLYDIKLHLESSGTEEIITARTWSEDFLIKETITLPAGDTSTPLHITDGGSAEDGYVLYTAPEGEETVIDVNDQNESCVKIDASWVIVRGLALKGASVHGIILGGVNNVVIEECDISGWGKTLEDGWGEDLNSAIYSESRKLETIIVQRCKLHHPRSDANSWLEPEGSDNHPQGPQGISLMYSKGNHVIRYNEIYSDKEHYFNDGMGEWHNFGYGGFPNRDSDIYGNRISHCWDDAIEAEGACMNVRIWGNYVDSTFMALGLAATSLGPHYVWRNVSNFMQRGPEGTDPGRYWRGGALFKVGAYDEQYAQGKLFLFHNTSLQPPPWTSNNLWSGVEAGVLVTSSKNYLQNITSRNNILHIRNHKDYSSIHDPKQHESNSFDYDMYNGKITAAPGAEKHGIKLLLNFSPKYDPNNGEGEFALQPGAQGYDAAQLLANFNDTFTDAGPDIGASEYGFPPMQYGVLADWTQWLHDRGPTFVENDALSATPEKLKFQLYSCYPNPFNLTVRITFELSMPADVEIIVYDMLGRQIRILADKRCEAGMNTLLWDGRGEFGDELPSGLYFIKMRIGDVVRMSKATLLK